MVGRFTRDSSSVDIDRRDFLIEAGVDGPCAKLTEPRCSEVTLNKQHSQVTSLVTGRSTFKKGALQVVQ